MSFFPPLEVASLKYSYGVWVSAPSGVRGGPQRKSNFVHFSLRV